MLTQQLAQLKTRQHRDHEEDQAGDGDNEFCLQAHAAERTYSSTTSAAVVLPYSFNLLCNVLRLIPSISAARVLLFVVDSSVLRMRTRSASSTVVPTSSMTEFARLSFEGRMYRVPKPGGSNRDSR